MNSQRKSRTNLDLLFAMVEMSGGRDMADAFKRQALPHLSLSPKARQEISEEEYQDGLAKISNELPHFLAHLGNKQFPPPTADNESGVAQP